MLGSRWGPLLLGHRGTETVEPLLLVVDIIEVQGVGLAMGRIQRADAKNVLSWRGTEKEIVSGSFKGVI